ncbi:MAG: rolling circle replication-associated protein [Acidimicrobiales bacterium]
MRRYAASNRLNRLGTLTYAVACHDQLQLRADVGRFFRAVRSELGEPFPYLWVPEWHPGGHGLHVHFAVGRYIRHTVIKDAWSNGIVHIKLIGDIPIGSAQLGEARVAARYLAKYVRKGLTDAHDLGMHRYECAQGFQPRFEQIVARTAWDAIAEASDRMGEWPALIWRSRDAESWYGPPAVWASWDR